MNIHGGILETQVQYYQPEVIRKSLKLRGADYRERSLVATQEACSCLRKKENSYTTGVSCYEYGAVLPKAQKKIY